MHVVVCMMEAKELAALSGQCTRNVRARVDNKADNALDTSLRSVPAENLASSGASLIVVRDPLVERWKYQIEAHVSQKALRSFIDETTEDLPSNFELAAYDVVVTSLVGWRKRGSCTDLRLNWKSECLSDMALKIRNDILTAQQEGKCLLF
ncbi:hypothetical protein L915_10897 [Phytophthora nicotianae]|uniref:Uncharacterized protein n=1 Tax=Phytophthora nicotianae TaxID=4792 RepID=W2GMG9_PHYNI|nr:hypothetical protein L915_10897 [Phytophthora nicotianae]